MKSNEEKLKDRDQAISDARWILMNPYFIVDTETTGLNNAQMCQIAIVKSDGTQYKSLIKPTVPIEKGATEVHHISDEDVKDAPTVMEIMRYIPIFGIFVAYNANFDWKIIEQSLKAHGHIFSHNVTIYDAMTIYSAFKGEWDEYHGNYKWHKLIDACGQCGIEGDDSFHDALYDAAMTDKLLKYISVQKISTEI